MTAPTTARSTAHASFTIERTYAASPERVFHALSNEKAKLAWFGGPGGWSSEPYRMDFRVGGHERGASGASGGPIYLYDGTFQDIVPNERIVSTYEMQLDGNRISVSLSTVVLAPVGKGTKLTYTEQAVFLDGYDKPSDREHGTNALFDALGKTLDAANS